jgi:apolipoprotein N-acyltransferase
VPGLGPLSFVALAPLLVGIDRDPSPRAAAHAGFACGLVFHGLGWFWIPLIGVDGWFLVVGFPIYVAILSLATSALAAAIALLRTRSRALALAAAPGLWVAFELARSQGQAGLPWLFLGHALADHAALVQGAALGGAPLLSLWIVATNVALVAPRTRAARVAAVALAIGLPAAAGALRLALHDRALERPESLDVAVVQPAIPHAHRHVRPHFDENLRELLALTDAAALAGPALIVWPESAYERRLVGDAEPLLSTIGNGYGVPLLTGLRRQTGGREPSLYNSAALAHGDGRVEAVADKVKPVPVYEAAPTSALARALARLGFWPGRFGAGAAPGLFELERRGAAPLPVGVLVCFDSSYPALARDLRRRGARLLVEISNRAQTTRWSARGHALAARLRAVEVGLPLVRAENVGPSEWIDALGRVRGRLASDAAAQGVRPLELAAIPTLYARAGDGPLVFAALATPALGALLRRRPRAPRPGGREELVTPTQMETPR